MDYILYLIVAVAVFYLGFRLWSLIKRLKDPNAKGGSCPGCKN